MHFDELMKSLGEFGRYQQIRFFLLCLFAITSAWHALNMVFVGASPDFRCNMEHVNLSQTPLAGISARDKNAIFLPNGEEEACYQYGLDDTMDRLESVSFNWTLMVNSNLTRNQMSCSNGYVFSREEYKETITTEFNLVCEKKFWLSTSKSVFFAGRLVGAVVFGQLSDKFGRRPMFFAGVILLLAAGTVASFATSMYMFLPMYFLQGCAHTGAFLVSYTLSTELVGPKYRVIAGFVIQSFYSIGFMSLAGIAYFIRDWRYLELAITLPAVLFGLYYWFLPESVRWLLSRGRDDEAEKILRAVANQNRKSLDKGVISALKEDKPVLGNKQYNVLDCLRTWSMARLSLNIWFNWLVNALVYYGLSLNTENLAGSPYLNFCVAGAVEIPAYIICIVMLNRVGRRWPLIISMYIGGIACILSGTLVVDGDIGKHVTVGLAMIGKFGITASYGIIYLMAAEIFPTVIRNIGMGVSSMSARIGGILAPIILDLSTVAGPLPLIIFGVLSLVAGSLAFLLPETNGRKLPQLPEDVDHGKSCADLLCCKRQGNVMIDLDELESKSPDY